MFRSSVAFLFAVFLCIPLASSSAQNGAAVDPSKAANAAGMVPAQTLASVSLWPKSLAAGPSMEFAPLEVITAMGLEFIGIDPLKLERIDVLIGMPGPMGVQAGALVQSSEPIDLSKLNPDMLSNDEMVDDKGFKYLVMDTPEEVIIHPLNDRTLVIGTTFFAKAMVKNPSPDNDVASVLAAIKSEQDAMVVLSISSLRPLLEGFAETAPLPPDVLSDVNTLIEGVEFTALRLIVSTEEKLQLVVSATDEDAADSVETSLANILRFATDQMLEDMQRNMAGESPTQQAMVTYAQRVTGEMLAGLKPVQTENQLRYEINDFQQANVAATLTGLLLPAVQSARFSARSMQSMNNLKQLGLAMHNFESAYKSLPAAGGVGDDGRAMLSWRVAVLPFIGEQQLYQRFNLDEPWDSEQNLALLEEMPAVYKHPNRNTPPGHTVYMAPISEMTMLQAAEPTRFGEITDGLSNTIMLLETSEELAVPWTAPQDYELDIEDPTAGLFVKGILNILMGDGSVRAIQEGSIDMDVMRALFTRAGGEVVQLP